MHKHTLISFCILAVIGTVIFAATLHPHQIGAQQDTTLPPSAPLAVIAQVKTEGGVHLSWIASQAGTFQIDHYSVLRAASQDSSDYSEIATIPTEATTYDDPDGVAGNSYIVQAVDNQDPPEKSVNDSGVVAEKQTALESPDNPTINPTPVNNLTISPWPAPANEPTSPLAGPVGQSQTLIPPDQPAATSPSPSSSPLPSNSSIPSTTTEPQNTAAAKSDLNQLLHNLATTEQLIDQLPPQQKVEQINTITTHYLDQLNQLVVAKKDNLAAPILFQFKTDKLKIIDTLSSLDQKTKTSAQNTCAQQETTLETTMTTLFESVQEKAIEALAACHIIMDR